MYPILRHYAIQDTANRTLTNSGGRWAGPQFPRLVWNTRANSGRAERHQPTYNTPISRSTPKRPEWSFQFRFLRHSFVYVSHLPLHAMCPAYLILLDLITQRICSEQYKWWSSSLSRDSSFNRATRYRMDCPGIESRWGARFSAPVQTGPGLTRPPIQWVPGWHPAPSSAEVKERVELCFYSPFGPLSNIRCAFYL